MITLETGDGTIPIGARCMGYTESKDAASSEYRAAWKAHRKEAMKAAGDWIRAGVGNKEKKIKKFSLSTIKRNLIKIIDEKLWIYYWSAFEEYLGSRGFDTFTINRLLGLHRARDGRGSRPTINTFFRMLATTSSNVEDVGFPDGSIAYTKATIAGITEIRNLRSGDPPPRYPILDADLFSWIEASIRSSEVVEASSLVFSSDPDLRRASGDLIQEAARHIFTTRRSPASISAIRTAADLQELWGTWFVPACIFYSLIPSKQEFMA